MADGALDERSDVPTPRPAPSGFSPKPVLRPREQIEKHIQDAILSSALKNGDRLPSEGDLARDFGVSRNTVREALRSLTAKGFIRKVPGTGGGSFVRRIDPVAFQGSLADSVQNLLQLGTIDVSEIIEVRGYLEIPATRLAALHRTDDDIATIEKYLTAAQQTTVDDPQVPELDASFHTAVAAASKNRILASFVGALHTATQPVRYLNLTAKFAREAIKQHRRIVKAIVERDPDAAEEAIRDHLAYIDKHTQR